MILRYLVDTDWAINYLHDRTEFVRRLNAVKEEGLAISAVSLAELYEGVYNSSDPKGNEKDLIEFLRAVEVVGVDEETCKIFGKERGRLRARKRLIGDFDLVIGATARRHNLTVLTNNRRHFERIEGIRLESI